LPTTGGSSGIPAQEAFGPFVTEVRNAKRAKPSLIERAILEFCHLDFRTPKEIATALRRQVKTLKEHHLPRILEADRLELRYPDAPTHPQQAYRTKKESDS
jgi:ATP-dependent DNA helicase RecG